MDLPVAASIILSAGTYLFDFGSNIAAVIEYSRYDDHRLMSKGFCDSSSSCSRVKGELKVIVMCMVGVLILAHTLNAVMFKLKFKQEDCPLRAAYFLPLIHLWRLADLLWRTLSFKGVQDLRSGEMNGLYSILGSSLEGAPLIMLQFCAYLTLFGISTSDYHLVFVKVSFIASALSVAYNGATSVLSVAKNAKTLNARLTLALAAGLFTLFATGIRSFTYAYLLLSRETGLFCGVLHCRAVTLPLFFALSLSLYWLFYWLLQFPKAFSQRLRDPKRCLASFTFAYMSIILGSLYPMVSEAKDAGQLGRPIFHARLVLVVLLSVSADVTMLYPIYQDGVHGLFTLLSLIGVVGCVVCMCGYIGIEIAISKLYSRFEELDGEGLKNNQGVDLDGCEVTNTSLISKEQSSSWVTSRSMQENCISDEEGFLEEDDRNAHAIVSLSDIEVEVHKPKGDWDDDHSKKNRGVDLDGCEVTNPSLISKKQSLSFVTRKSMRDKCISDDAEEILKEDDTHNNAHAIVVSVSENEVKVHKPKEEWDHDHANEMHDNDDTSLKNQMHDNDDLCLKDQMKD